MATVTTIVSGEVLILGGEGSRTYYGVDIPENTLGVNQDLYIRTNGDYYKKTGGAWAFMFNVIGRAGTPLVNRGVWVNGMTVNPSDFVYARSTDDVDVQAMFVSKMVTAFTSTTEPYLDTASWQEFSGIPGAKGDVGPAGNDGENAWTAVFAIVADDTRRVMQVVGWFGGSGTMPGTGMYLGATGFVENIADATDLRGPAGSGGGGGTGTVDSVNGVAPDGDGNVTLTKANLSLGNVDNTSDANKPISTATQAALNAKADNSALANKADITYVDSGLAAKADTSTVNAALATKAPIDSPTFTGTVGGVSKAMVGLGSVDNTSDVNKPVSSATQTALNLKANLASPTFTGTPAAPTATPGTNTTQVATTAFVKAATDAIPAGRSVAIYVSSTQPTGGTYFAGDVWITPQTP